MNSQPRGLKRKSCDFRFFVYFQQIAAKKCKGLFTTYFFIKDLWLCDAFFY